MRQVKPATLYFHHYDKLLRLINQEKRFILGYKFGDMSMVNWSSYCSLWRISTPQKKPVAQKNCSPHEAKREGKKG